MKLSFAAREVEIEAEAGLRPGLVQIGATFPPTDMMALAWVTVADAEALGEMLSRVAKAARELEGKHP